MTDPVARVRRLAAQALAHRRALWNRLQVEYPAAAADLAALAATFGKPAHTRLWIAGEQVWPTTGRKNSAEAYRDSQEGAKAGEGRGETELEKTRPQKASPGAGCFRSVKPTFTEPVDGSSIASAAPQRNKP